jgi:hypothetical protein
MKASLNKRDNPKKTHQSNTLCSNFYLLKLMRRDDGLQGLGFSVQMHDLHSIHPLLNISATEHQVKTPSYPLIKYYFFLSSNSKNNTYSEFEFKN